MSHSPERKAKDAARRAWFANLPTVVVPKFCGPCGADITGTYKGKWGYNCKSCIAEYQRIYREANAERIAESKKAWKVRNAEHVKAKDRAYADMYPERRAAARKRWDEANPGVTAAAKAANKRDRAKRVPLWLSEDDRWLIAETYKFAKLRTQMTGIRWTVDHIIPIKGKLVSGLHVPENLRVVPFKVNARKGNNFEVTV